MIKLTKNEGKILLLFIQNNLTDTEWITAKEQLHQYNRMIPIYKKMQKELGMEFKLQHHKLTPDFLKEDISYDKNEMSN